MGVLNVTPDSFHAHHETPDLVRDRVRQMVQEGADIIDVGACSTRPGAVPVDEEEEMRRLRWSLPIVRQEAPRAIVSVDTFRASVAKMCVEEAGAQMVNDIGGGERDDRMFGTVAALGVPYVLTHSTPIEATSDDKAMAHLLRDLGRRLDALHEQGVCDVILDPGFGFSKTREQDFAILRNLEALHELEQPLLVGVSRKRMVCETLSVTPEEALNGTTVLHTICLQKGAHILRVHDVRQAKECIKIIQRSSCEKTCSI